MDFDPRWSDDPRDRDDYGRELSQGSRGGLSNPREREPLGPRDVFTRDLELPRGRERGRVCARDGDVTLRGSEVRTLATVGAFRVVPAGDLRDGEDRPLDPQQGDLRHLRDQGLVETIPAIGSDRALVVLTERGRDVLERNRWSSVHRSCGGRPWNESSAAIVMWTTSAVALRNRKPGRRSTQVCEASVTRVTPFAGRATRRSIVRTSRRRKGCAMMTRASRHPRSRAEARVQEFLQERNRRKPDSDGKPDRTPEEIHRWAMARRTPDPRIMEELLR